MSMCIGTEIHNVGTFGLNKGVTNAAMLERYEFQGVLFLCDTINTVYNII